MKIQNAVALVTGANRGLGLELTRALVAAGVRKVYAGARDPASVTASERVVPLRLDVTRRAEVEAAARACGDVTLLINNAGISRSTSFLAADSVEAARAELETNFFGMLTMCRAFAPTLAAQGGGAIINVLSVLSWMNLPGAATYSASKAAAWSLTGGLRNELSGQRTQVMSLHVGYMDTGMAAHVSVAKARPDEVARGALAALEAGQVEYLADELSQRVKRGLSTGHGGPQG